MKEREREFIPSFVKTINGKGGKESKIKLGFPTARQTVRFQSKKGRILINEKERKRRMVIRIARKGRKELIRHRPAVLAISILRPIDNRIIGDVSRIPAGVQ